VSLLLELLRWWAVATVASSVLLLVVVVLRTVADAVRRPAVRQRSASRVSAPAVRRSA
jgi:hypothetical protein